LSLLRGVSGLAPASRRTFAISRLFSDTACQSAVQLRCFSSADFLREKECEKKKKGKRWSDYARQSTSKGQVCDTSSVPVLVLHVHVRAFRGEVLDNLPEGQTGQSKHNHKYSREGESQKYELLRFVEVTLGE
jgi:hypothetical protein